MNQKEKDELIKRYEAARKEILSVSYSVLFGELPGVHTISGPKADAELTTPHYIVRDLDSELARCLNTVQTLLKYLPVKAS